MKGHEPRRCQPPVGYGQSSRRADKLLFEDMDEETAGQSPRMFQLSGGCPPLKEEAEPEPSDPMLRQETIELVKAYYKLPNRKAVKHLYEFIVAMSKTVVNAEQEEQI